MSDAPDVSIVLHTRDRPEYVSRALTYYLDANNRASFKILVSDGSSEENWNRINSIHHDPSRVQLFHYRTDVDFVDRLLDTVQRVETTYVALAADDDFYVTSWFQDASELLGKDESIGVVYGHTLKFWLPRFRPYGKDVSFSVSEVRNPAPRWLEAHEAKARLLELGNIDAGFATTGWYAMQRTEVLAAILRHAQDSELSPLGLERFMTFYHAAFWRTRMLDQIYLARQVNLDERRPPISFKESAGEVAKIIALCSELLISRGHMAPAEAHDLVARVFRGELEWMKRADKKRLLRGLADRAPFLRSIWRKVGRAIPALSTTPPLEADPRLPRTPRLNSDDPIIEKIRRALAEPSPPARDKR